MRFFTSRHFTWVPILLMAFCLTTAASAQSRQATGAQSSTRLARADGSTQTTSSSATARVARQQPVQLRGGGITITQNTSQDIVAGTGVACPTPPNSFYRVFDLASFNLTDDLAVSSVDIGIEEITNAGATTVNLFRLNGAFTLANLTQVGTATVNVSAADNLTLRNVPITGQFGPTDMLVVEWAVPQAGAFFGGNQLGQSGPTFIRAAACGAVEPADLGGLGFPNSAWVVNVSGTVGGTVLSPELVLNPEALSATVAAGGTTSVALQIMNTGTADLTFAFPAFAAARRIESFAALGINLQPLFRASSVEMPKGVEGLTVPGGTGMQYRVGGPDGFGYTFIDSDEPGGPVFDTVDIGDTGTEQTLASYTGCTAGDAEDEGRVAVTLPFTFPFYGQDVTELQIYANGVIGTDAAFAACTFSNAGTVPLATGLNGLIAPFWDDIDLGDTGRILTEQLADGRFVIQWDEAPRFGGSETAFPNTFQAILSEDGTVTFQYLSITTPTLASQTVGIENQAGTAGLAANINTAGYTVDGLAVSFIPPTLFISDVDPSGGTVTPGGMTTVTVTLDASDLTEGVYMQDLLITTNDADEASVLIPVTLTVTGGGGGGDIVVTPSPVVETLASGDTGTESVTLTNNTDEAVTYSFPQYASTARPEVPARRVHQAMELGKGQADPRSGTQSAFMDEGGPDAFGYQWIDSNEPGGPTYDFVDISGTGTAVPLGDDEAAEVPIGFTFSFYGEDYTSVFISSNGFLTFGIGSGAFTNGPIPAADGTDNLIAPFWDDLDPGDGNGTIYYQDMGDGRFIVQYDGVPDFPGPGPGTENTFEVILNQNGAILFQYEDINGDRIGNTVGIENGDATDGLQIAFNQAYVEDGLAVLIQARPAFLTDITPASGTIPANSSVTVDFTFDATGLLGGQYTGEVDLVTSIGTLSVPVVLNVTGMPTVTVSPERLQFGGVIVGATSELDATISNNGTSDLEVTAVTSDNAAYTVDFDGPLTIAPGDSAMVTVTFAPTAVGPTPGTLSVVSNASSSPDTARLRGNGLAAPNFSVSPTSLSVTLEEGETETRTLTLSNTGAGVGSFTAEGIVVGTFVEPTPSARSADAMANKAGSWARADGATTGTSVGIGGRPTTILRQGGVTITQNVSQAIEVGSGVACPTPPNAILRRFDLSDFAINGELNVETVQFGIESVSGAQTATINLYRLEGEFVRANLTLVGTGQTQISPADDLSIVEVPVDGTFSEDDVMVVEWTYPLANTFFGGNGAGQSGPTYVQADGCNVFEPADIGTLGFPDSHWVVNVTGTSGPSLVSVSPESGNVQAGASRDLTVTINASSAPAGVYQAEVRITTNDPDTPVLVVPITINLIVANEGDSSIPTEVMLFPSYPNPVASATTLKFGLPEPSMVRMQVYDVAGRLVRTVVEAEQAAGYHEVRMDASSLASGLYFVRMQAGNETRTVRLSVVR